MSHELDRGQLLSGPFGWLPGLLRVQESRSPNGKVHLALSSRDKVQSKNQHLQRLVIDFIPIEKLTLWRMLVFWWLQYIAFAGRLLTVRKPPGGGASPCGEAAKGLTITITRPGRCLVPADLSSVGQTNVSCAVMRAQSPFRLTPLQNRQDQSTHGDRQPLEGQ